MQPYVRELIEAVEQAVPGLLALGDESSARRPGPGKWSPREIVGHLVDSASNNHQRFVRAQFQDDLVFTGYAQDHWVEAQCYQDADWAALVALWAAYNRHLARVMSLVPQALCERPHARHNLHQVAFRTFAADEPATLGAFMADYVAHLRHHLRQILGESA